MTQYYKTNKSTQARTTCDDSLSKNPHTHFVVVVVVVVIGLMTLETAENEAFNDFDEMCFRGIKLSHLCNRISQQFYIRDRFCAHRQHNSQCGHIYLITKKLKKKSPDAIQRF